MIAQHSRSVPLVTFVIPVRHQDNARDWDSLRANLQQTIGSIAAQTSDDWQAIVVANEGADLPDLPAQFHIERVQFPPNLMHEEETATREDFLDAFRLDKGRRVLSGMMAGRGTRYFMVVDDDDFVSRDIVHFIASQEDCPGWKIDRGYVWNDGGSLVLAHDDFNHICGTSLIINAKIYSIPDTPAEVSISFIKEMLGSHHGVDKLLETRRTPLKPLGFRGAMYRVANPGSHSRTPGFLKKYIFLNGWYLRPRETLWKLRRIRKFDTSLRAEFCGTV